MTQSTISISPGLTFDTLVSGERDAATPVAAARICKVAASDGQRPTYPRARWKNIAVLGNKETMEAALAWYRARGAIRSPLGPIRVPTLYNWSYDDDAVGPAAEGTVFFVVAPIVSRCWPAAAISSPTRSRP
jgi:pimeloyl-ACP methyl ester carboxylesterase